MELHYYECHRILELDLLVQAVGAGSWAYRQDEYDVQGSVLLCYAIQGGNRLGDLEILEEQEEFSDQAFRYDKSAICGFFSGKMKILADCPIIPQFAEIRGGQDSKTDIGFHRNI